MNILNTTKLNTEKWLVVNFMPCVFLLQLKNFFESCSSKTIWTFQINPQELFAWLICRVHSLGNVPNLREKKYIKAHSNVFPNSSIFQKFSHISSFPNMELIPNLPLPSPPNCIPWWLGSSLSCHFPPLMFYFFFCDVNSCSLQSTPAFHGHLSIALICHGCHSQLDQYKAQRLNSSWSS